MRIKIKADWLAYHIQAQDGSTWAEKRSAAERTADKDSPSRPWYDKMQSTAGTWVQVNKKHLFEDQFNTDTARVGCYYIEAIDFSPQFKNADEFLAAVQKNYDKNWAGREAKPIIKRLIELQQIIDETPEPTHPKK